MRVGSWQLLADVGLASAPSTPSGSSLEVTDCMYGVRNQLTYIPVSWALAFTTLTFAWSYSNLLNTFNIVPAEALQASNLAAHGCVADVIVLHFMHYPHIKLSATFAHSSGRPHNTASKLAVHTYSSGHSICTLCPHDVICFCGAVAMVAVA